MKWILVLLVVLVGCSSITSVDVGDLSKEKESTRIGLQLPIYEGFNSGEIPSEWKPSRYTEIVEFEGRMCLRASHEGGFAIPIKIDPSEVSKIKFNVIFLYTDPDSWPGTFTLYFYPGYSLGKYVLPSLDANKFYNIDFNININEWKNKPIRGFGLAFSSGSFSTTYIDSISISAG